MAAAVGVIVALGSCGAHRTSSAAAGGTVVEVRYEAVHEGGESGGTPQVLHVFAQGERSRVTISDASTPDDPYQTVVWDGHTMLLLEGDQASREKDPPADQRPSSYFMRAGDATFNLLCPGGVREESATVAGRPGTVYTCPAHGSGDATTAQSRLTLDDATGLLLGQEGDASHLKAVDVRTGVAIDETTFSTDIPAGMHGAEGSTDEEGSPRPLTATDTVPLAGGGELQLAKVRNGPSLVVIGELAGVKDMLATVLPRTSSGKAPRVYVLLNPIPFDDQQTAAPDLSLATEEGTRKLLAKTSAQASDIPVPVGIDIKGGAAGEDLRSFEDLMAGTAILAAIDDKGALAWRATDKDLATSTEQLDTWLTANK